MGKKPRVRQDSNGFDIVPDECSKSSKASIGKKAAEKSGGLFSADDWMCKSCGNINWARRFVCNMCNAPKFQKNEARTGNGGGYNEREGVEYKERTESDDEYDEFGRIKKKFRASDRKQDDFEDKKPKKNDEENVDLAKYKLDDSVDEDEDEDDDDFDPSKYDLIGDLSDSKKSDPESRGKSSHSRSRSSSRRSKKGSSSRSRSRSRRRSSERYHPVLTGLKSILGVEAGAGIEGIRNIEK
ncbi:zinc finger Ran-binding domain-containing 2-like isoform X1 [Brachionus plicatilis]|uniref:Zinc finger Ran-binding domain-containing 2-like isoform X1 n=1 Tax=Brachionus plicatilis TaxID=10195 RepID=A0A3M7P617_BRAPC|nr:zinc finger Ran-binding domain-containing 2-like isoform X1 [Brachionus plicatilis]